MKSALRTPTIAACLTILAAISYARALEVPFFWDDKPLILYNPYLGRTSGFTAFFSPRFWKESHYPADYRPLDMFSYSFDCLFWMKNPAGYHLTNILMHIFNCVAVYLLLRMLFENEPLAALAGFLYALHPIHSEAVIWIQNRSDLLVTALSLTTLIAFVRLEKGKSSGQRTLFVIFLSFACALLTKENAIVVPLLLVAVLPYLRTAIRRRTVMTVVSLAAIAAAFLLLKMLVLHQLRHEEVQPPPLSDWPASIFSVVKLILIYFSMLILPVNFSLDRSFSVSALPPALAVALYGAAITLLLVVAIKELVLRRPTGFAVLFTLVSLLPACNIVLLAGRPIAEQRLYFPSIGFCLLVALLFQSIRGGALPRRLTVLCIVSLFLWYLLITVKRTDCWLREQVLWERTLEVSPNSWRSKLFLAAIYGKQERYKEAVNLLKEVLRACFPRPANAFKELGIIYGKLHWNERAIDAFKSALRSSPDHLESRIYLGDALKRIGKYDAAREHYRFVERRWPTIGEGQLRLGILYKEERRYDEAIRELEKLLSLYPDNENALVNLASIYGYEGRDREAEELFERMIAQNPRSAPAHNDYGLYLERRGRHAEAFNHYAKAVSCAPDAMLPRYNLAQAYLHKGEKSAALLELLKAAQVQPDRDDILEEIGLLGGAVQESQATGALAGDISREYVKLLNRRGVYLARIGNTSAARGCFQKLAALLPNDGQARANLGRIYAEEGNYAMALVELLAAADRLPAEASVYSSMGSCYAALGRIDDARRAWNKALELDPQAKEPRRNLARMRNSE